MSFSRNTQQARAVGNGPLRAFPAAVLAAMLATGALVPACSEDAPAPPAAGGAGVAGAAGAAGAAGTGAGGKGNTCAKGGRDEGEGAVDCGGKCKGCEAGVACTSSADCLSGLCKGGACTSPVSFGAKKQIAPAGYQSSLVTGDFNGDKRPDLALSDYNAKEIRIYLGSGDGTFTAGTTLLRDRPILFGAADFDADGRVDLAVSHSVDLEERLAVMPGDRVGSFQNPPAASEMKLRPYLLEIADVDGDGAADMGIVESSSSALSVVRGLPGGGLSKPIAVGSSSRKDDYKRIVTGDFDGDGGIDVLWWNSTEKRGDIFLQSPGWLEKKAITPASALLDLNARFGGVAADLNKDGRADLVISPSYPPSIEVALSGEGAVFSPFQTAHDESQNPNAGYQEFVQVFTADLDGDSNLDVCFVDAGNIRTLYVLLGAGDGTLGKARPVAQVVRGTFAVADFDGDGRVDIASGQADLQDPSTSGVFLMLNTTPPR